MATTMGDFYNLNYTLANSSGEAAGQLGWPWDKNEPGNSWLFYAGIARVATRLAQRLGLLHGVVANTSVEAFVVANPGSIQDSYNIQEPWYGS